MDAAATSSSTELHYTGEELVPPSSLLRAMPDVVAAEERLRVDALAFSADALWHAWNTMREVAAYVGTDTSRLTTRHRAGLLMAGWSIVDHLNVVRQVITSLPTDGEPGPLTAALLDATEPARKLRNKMDHLNSNVGNLAKAKGKRNALFGSLSYAFVPNRPDTEAFVIVVQTGMLHGSESWKVVNPAGRRIYPPADLFELSAFGIDFELGPPIAAYRSWLAASVPGWEADLNEKIAELAKSSGQSEEVLKGHRGGGYMIALALKFNEPLHPSA